MRPWFVGFPAVAVVVLLAACGGGRSPAAGSSPPSVTIPPPAPTPSPMATPTIFSCPLGNGVANPDRCPREAPSFLVELDAAIDRVVAQQPRLFDLNDVRGPGGYYVRSQGAFYVALIEGLKGVAGFCAAFDGEEIQIKNTNAWSDQYHVILSDGHLRRGNASYRATCYPAAFPIPGEGALPAPAPGCALGASREIACGRESPRFLSSIEGALDQVIQTRPDLVSDGVVTNVNGYFDAVVAAMRSRGFCSVFDGEEVVVKNANDFSEHYDVLISDGHIRRGDGAYRSTCYPAAF